MEKKSGISKLFSFFKQKEEINENILVDNNELSEDGKVVVVKGEDGDMVRADNFTDSSVMPEEYRVDESDLLNQNNVSEDVTFGDAGITVTDGDDLTPIIMDVVEVDTDEIVNVEEEEII